eukprot:372439-Rhodomonas_salina.1
MVSRTLAAAGLEPSRTGTSRYESWHAAVVLVLVVLLLVVVAQRRLVVLILRSEPPAQLYLLRVRRI